MGRSTANRVVKSIQRGILSTSSASSSTATISAVDVSKSEIGWLGSSNTVARLSLVNSTTVQVEHAGNVTATTNFQVTEYY